MSKCLPISSQTNRSSSIPWFKKQRNWWKDNWREISAVHGDLFTELFNKETKRTAGLFHSVFSTDVNTVNCWVNTIHIHVLLKKEWHICLHAKTGSKHKEITPIGIKTHVEHAGFGIWGVRLHVHTLHTPKTLETC